MLRVCSTAPIDGHGQVGLRCSALFHMNVPTRWSPSMPQAAQRPGQPAGPLGDLGERTAAGAVGRRGHDLGVGVHARRVLEEAGELSGASCMVLFM